MGVREEVIELLAECAGSTQKTAEILFPDLFSRVWTQLHYQIFDLLDNSDNPKKAIIAPRGIGKTSICNILLPAKAALFVQKRYIVPCSATSTLATQQSENLKNVLMTNPTITKLFGDVKTNVFNKEQWVVRVGGPAGEDICIMPRGAGQQVRGQLYRGRRPDLIIADDLEDPDDMDNEETRAKKKRWFYNDLAKAVDNYAIPVPWEIIVINTKLHQDALAVDLLENPDWDTLELEICDDNLKSNIPEWWDDEEVERQYRLAENEGNLEGFYREFRNKPNVGGKDAAFPKELFVGFNPNKVNLNDVNIDVMILVDPSRTKNPRSAESAVVTVAVNYATHEILVLDVFADKITTDELYEEIFRQQAIWKARVIGIEVTGLHEYVTYPILNELTRRGLAGMVHLEELHARGGNNEKGKIARVRSLIPFYRQKLIKHNKAVTAPLEAQLMSFPNAKRWDIMDALAYTVELLEKGERYMAPFMQLQGEDGKTIMVQESSEYSKQYAEREYEEILDSYSEEDEPIEYGRLV